MIIELILAQALASTEPNQLSSDYSVLDYAELLQPSFDCRTKYDVKNQALDKKYESLVRKASKGEKIPEDQSNAYMMEMYAISDGMERECKIKEAKQQIQTKVEQLNPDMHWQESRYLAAQIYGNLEHLDGMLKMFKAGNFQAPRLVAPVPPSSPLIKEND
ncbi:hypothetical protein [Sphingorhabdus sp. 109]|jgi:hypothetical protein|uniref:hypothetical protein n=1 Tax=Sphingorhabdus sp. 109 TaxID=2653173 RepID=UPI0012EF007D|nr:hypothetical protein [Sphingorhabdus sp. 109]VWX60825.1 hypothetical protein SPHINGOR109_50799 [Sphingorhabdus sp. 109]